MRTFLLTLCGVLFSTSALAGVSWIPGASYQAEHLDPYRGVLITESQDVIGLSNDGELRIGLLDHAMEKIEWLHTLDDSAMEADIAESGTLRAVVWNSLQSRDDIGSEHNLLVQIFDSRAQPVGLAKAFGESGFYPKIVGHGDGWLVSWVSAWTPEPQVSVLKLDSLGTPVGEPHRIDRFSASEGRSPDLLDLGNGKGLLVWQEGRFYFRCQLTCPSPPADGIIRLVTIEEGAPLPETEMVVDREGRVGQPAIGVSADGRVLLAFFEQHQDNSPLMSLVVTRVDGYQASSAIEIAEVLNNGISSSIHVTSVREGFLVTWIGDVGTVAEAEPTAWSALVSGSSPVLRDVVKLDAIRGSSGFIPVSQAGGARIFYPVFEEALEQYVLGTGTLMVEPAARRRGAARR